MGWIVAVAGAVVASLALVEGLRRRRQGRLGQAGHDDMRREEDRRQEVERSATLRAEPTGYDVVRPDHRS